MKKILSFLLTFIFIFLVILLSGTNDINNDAFGITAEAEDELVLTFVLNSDENSYGVYDCDKDAKGTITVPAMYKELPVTKITDHAFSNCKKITDIVIEYGIIEIGHYAFYYCEDLINVSIPNSVKNIGYGAFISCESLSSIAIPDSVKTIEHDAFSCCSALTSVTIGNGVTKIGNNAFGVDSTYDSYSACKNIKKVFINDMAKWCEIEFENEYSNPLYFARNEASLYLNNEPVKNLVIPKGVKKIEDFAFINCKGINSLTIPNGVRGIGKYAFYGCKNIYAVTLPDSVSSIGENCFHSNTALTCTCQSSFSDKYKTIHNYSKSWTVDKVTTAKAAGSKSYHCIDCGKKTGVTSIPRLAPGSTILGKISNNVKGVKITWSAVNGADKYVIYRKTGSSNWKLIGTVNSKSLNYLDTSAKSGTKYSYTVRAVNPSGSGGFNKTGLSILYLAIPSKITIKNVANGVSIIWTKVAKAKGYEVLRKTTSGKWSRVALIKNQSTVTITDKKVSNGSKYIYTVVPYNGKYRAAEKTTSSIMYLSSPKITKIKSTRDGIYLRWTKNSKATGYIVYRKVGNGKYKKHSTIYCNFVNDGYDIAVRGKKYTYRVIAYKGTFKSSYENTKSCTDRYYY